MPTHYTPKGKHLTIAERRLIEKWKDEEKSNHQIALLLGKAPQTIHNDIKRELVRQQVRKGRFELLYSEMLLKVVTNQLERSLSERVDLIRLSRRKSCTISSRNTIPKYDGKCKESQCPHIYHLLLDSSWTDRTDLQGLDLPQKAKS